MGEVVTPEEINKAIAEACGWKLIKGDFVSWGKVAEREGGKTTAWRNPQGICYEPCLQHIPNYHGDLNACHEMERTLTDQSAQVSYCDTLFRVIHKTRVVGTGVGEFDKITATAPQRCEAFLRVKGLWK